MANPFFVQPAQYGPALQQAAGAVQQFGQQRQEGQRRQEAEAYKQEAKQAMAAAFQSGDPAAIRQAVIQYPEIAEAATQMFGFTNEQTEQVARETYRRALSETDSARRAAILEGGIETVRQFGGRPSVMSRDLQMLRENPEAFERSARAGYAALASDQEYEAMFPESSASQAPAGVREFEAMIQAAESDNPTISDAALVNLGLKPRAGLSAEERILQSEELTRLKAELERLKSGEREAGQQAVKLSGEAFERLNQVKSTIPKYDRAIELVRQGANTGALASRLPSITASAIELDNLQSQLGLDVISNTTFGALSEGELRLALQTALPTGLEGDDLVEWLESRKESQQKLARYLEEAAQFLGTPGNTVAGFMRMKREGGEDGQPEGNKAMSADDADTFIDSILQGQ